MTALLPDSLSPNSSASTEGPAPAPPAPTSHVKESPVAGRRERIWGRLDPVISTLARSADEDPAAMRRLLDDPMLQWQLLLALEAVTGDGPSARVAKSS